MANKKELINILKAELTLLSQEILQNIHQKDTGDLYKSVRKLYEKMAAIHVLEKKLKDPDELLELIKPEDHKGKEITREREEVKPAPIENKEVKPPVEKNPDKKSLPVDDIDPYQQEITFVPKQKETQKTTKVSTSVSPSVPSPNSRRRKMSIGLNDRIAFIKNLFNGDNETYTQVIERLNAFDEYEDALKYIYSEVKPRFNNWEGKDEYEFRLIQLLELKFN